MQQLTTMDDALYRLLDAGGSDLIFSCGSPPRIRKDGNLEVLDGHPRVLMPSDTHRLLREILDPKQWKELERRRHVDFSFTWRDRARIRGNAYWQRNSIAAAFRLLPLVIPNFDMLGIPEAVHRLLERQHGLILVTGPTGCGKSTSQAAMIDHLNATRPFHIITIEDPIEYIHKHQLSIVDQRQVGEDTPSFVEGLRAAFREDPDVVLIGEMRDLETMSAAVSIAESGHLVLATLHTNDAPQALDRIIDSYLGAAQQQVRIQLASCVAGVIYQELVPAVGGGRVAAFEVLIANTAVRSMIKEGRTDQLRTVLQTSLREGSQTLERSLNQLVRAGLVSESDARRHSANPAGIHA
ncbi:MAG TPA: PilT/PilU family type 4a pilus ATPase [Candidatus Dormibacteraeota bacterium]|jgi:twitching motility protein PilT|nr:PilT/PilU family type 4a pilus ATPase [Candidatus Dormibacteraeota bacterium]